MSADQFGRCLFFFVRSQPLHQNSVIAIVVSVVTDGDAADPLGLEI